MGSDRYKVCFYNEKKQTNDMILTQMYSAGGKFAVCDLILLKYFFDKLALILHL